MRLSPTLRVFAPFFVLVLLASACGGSSSDTSTAAGDASGDSAAAAGDGATDGSGTGSSDSVILPTVDGGQIDFADIEGTDTILWFWAPW